MVGLFIAVGQCPAAGAESKNTPSSDPNAVVSPVDSNEHSVADPNSTACFKKVNDRPAEKVMAANDPNAIERNIDPNSTVSLNEIKKQPAIAVAAADSSSKAEQPEKPKQISTVADPNTVSQDQNEKDVTHEPIVTADPVDPNATDHHDDNEDVFMPKISTLVKINEAYESIFSPDFVTDDGMVRYAELRRKRSALLSAVKELDNLNPAILMSLSPQEKTAFWINAYNCCVLNLIIDHYPIEHKLYMIFYPNNSIMQITGDWRTKHFFEIQTMEYNLQEIEQEFLLQRTQDPRILFALSYASVGGALMRNEPYRAETLEEQLDDQVRRFLQAPQGMKIDKDKDILHLSNLFTMYQHKELFLDSEYAKIRRFRDRKPAEQAWLNFIRGYVSEDDVKYLESADFEVKFMKYDWLLNEAR